MIQFLVIIVGLIVLGLIFFRRYMILEKGKSSFSFLGRKQGGMDLLHLHKDKGGFEITVEEMIPERSSVDAKKVAKADILVKKAEPVLAKGDFGQGERLLIQALSLDPSNVDAYHKLGLLYLHQGQFGKAEMMYQKLILSVPNDPVYFSNLAVALYQQKKLEGAKSNYKKAIELDSSRAGRVFSLAQVLMEMGEAQEALDHFKKAISMDPKNVDYLLSLAQIYFDMNLHDDAKLILDEILAADPGNAMAKDMLRKFTEGGTGESKK